MEHNKGEAMTTTAIRWTLGIFRVAAVAAAIVGFGLAQAQTQTPAPANAPEPALFEMWDFGEVPRPAVTQALLRIPAVEQELKLTAAQKTAKDDVQKRHAARIREARSQLNNNAEFIAKRTAIFAETMTAQKEILKPEQRERLTQIQLQAQGPLAFSVREGQDGALIDPDVRFIGPRLSAHLKMSPDQVKRARELAEEATTQIRKAAQFTIPWDTKETPAAEAIRKFVEGAVFRSAKADARRSARKTWEAAIEHILALLNPEQRASYRKLVGKPFDFTTARIAGLGTETDEDIRTVTVALRRWAPRVLPVAASVPTPISKSRSLIPLSRMRPGGRGRRGSQQLPHGRRPVQAVRRLDHRRRVRGFAQHRPRSMASHLGVARFWSAPTRASKAEPARATRNQPSPQPSATRFRAGSGRAERCF